MKKNYMVIKDGNQYTLGCWWNKKKTNIVTNDGLYGHYWWETEEAAQEAVNAYNAYKGSEWLGEHRYGNDLITIGKDGIDVETGQNVNFNDKMFKLYLLFNAVEVLDGETCCSFKEYQKLNDYPFYV